MTIMYPYLPKGRGRAPYQHVPITNTYMGRARSFAQKSGGNSAAIVVKTHNIIGVGSIGNTSTRLAANDPRNHSARQALFNALRDGYVTFGADVYVWGDWWLCEDCWKAMNEAGIRNVYLLEGSERLFNKDHPDNIIGRQVQ